MLSDEFAVLDRAHRGLHESPKMMLLENIEWQRELDVYGTLREKVSVTKRSCPKDRQSSRFFRSNICFLCFL